MSLTRRGVVVLVWLGLLVPAWGLAQDTAGTGSIRGTVSTADGQPVAAVAVCVQALGRCAVTDDRGVFTIHDLRADQYVLEITAPGQPPLTSVVEVRAGLDAVVDVTIAEPDALTEVVSVTAPRFVAAEEVKTSGFLVSSSEVVQSAGALQDVARYVQALPGAVIGTDDFRNDLIVRGGSPLENLYIVDNVELPNINTFANFASAGGTVSMIDARLLQDVTFLTGGYPAAYGNRTSSVLQIALREGSRERTNGRATFGFAGAGVVGEGPLGNGRGSWIVSARRSVLDAVTDDIGIGGVPVLYTVNAKAVYDLSPRDRLWILNVTGLDRIRLGLAESSDLTSDLSTFDIRYRGGRVATGVNWQRTFGARGVGLLGVSYSRAWVRQRIGDLLRNGVPAPGTPIEEQLAGAEEVFREDSREGELGVKYDVTLYLPAVDKLQAGVSLKRLSTDYDAASPFGSDSPYYSDTDQNPFVLRERRAAAQVGGYLQASRRIGGRLNLTAGLRGDRFDYLDASRLSPRAGASVDLSPRMAVQMSAGRYYQQPFFLFLAAFPQNRALEPFAADHLVGGWSFTPDDTTKATIEVYEKRYRDYPVSSQIASLSLANIGDTFAVRDVLFPMVSRGRGRARGVEMYVERKARDGARWYGQANLSISRTRHAGTDGELRPGSFDYPVAANLLGTYRLSPRWDLSARVTYLAGRPYTPLDEEASARQRRAVFELARVNDARGPAYFRADLRADWHIRTGDRPVSIFFGAQNVTNRRNLAGYGWDRRGNVLKPLEQLGLFPIAGLDWQF